MRINKELKNYIELENDYLLGMSGFIMRKFFYFIHELMAKELIERIYEKDINAHDFLLFYNGKTILIDDQKYVIPSLETADGKQRNNSSIIGICKLWMSTKRRKELFEQKLVDTQMKIETINKKLIHIKPEKDREEQRIIDAEKEAIVVNKQHAELESKLNYLEQTNYNNQFFELQKEVQASQKEVDKLIEIIQGAKANLKAIKDANKTTYTELDFYTNQKKEVLHDIKTQALNINTKTTQMDPIIESIVRVLMDRTKLIKTESLD